MEVEVELAEDTDIDMYRGVSVDVPGHVDVDVEVVAWE